MKRLTTLAAGAAAALLVGSATPAQAATDNLAFNQNGGTVVNSVYSNTTLRISSTTYTMRLPIGSSSKNWYQYQDVDYFWVEVGCVAKNVQTGYKYWPNGTLSQRYALASDSVYIGLEYDC